MPDIVVVGGGIAGVSVAAELSDRADVVVVEAEPTLGYHATGRSAAIYTECTGTEPVRRLARMSLPFFTEGESDLTTPKPILFVSGSDEDDLLTSTYDEFSPIATTIRRVSPAEAVEICNALDPAAISGGVYEPDAVELDVAGIETAFRTTAKRNGVEFATSCRAISASRMGSGDTKWMIETSTGEISADIVVNAAGAWGDEVADMADVAPLGLEAMKRSAFIFTPNADPAGWPMLYDAGHRWYCKPEGPNMLGSASSEIVSKPHDARPDELDIALGIERINEHTTLAVRSIKSSWAGLRVFTPDRIPAVGFDSASDGFFWLVGQGGYGIKTAPALAKLAATLILDGAFSDTALVETLSPTRFR